ncbi:MAG: hypothetical protein ABIP41_02280 [Croceibacterium sp.]
MIVADRRQMLRLAAAAALLPVLAARSASALPATRFAPPSAPMRYTRTLRRELAGGAAIVVSRSFSVRFMPLAAGFRIDGEQVAVSVAAPPALARFAELERERRELGLFPLVLDNRGLITGAPSAIDTAGLDEAVKAAAKRFDVAGFAPGERSEADRFVSALHQDASRLVTALPRDLFAPSKLQSAATRDVMLPDGGQGVVTVRFTAQTDPATGLMKQAQREVVTNLSGDQRRTIEDWSLALL